MPQTGPVPTPSPAAVRATGLPGRARSWVWLALLLMLVAATLARVGDRLPARPGPETWEGSSVAAAVAASDARPGLRQALLTWSDLTEPWVLLAGLTALAVALVATGRRSRGALLLPVLGLLGWGLGTLVKLVVARPRPDEALYDASGYSYPSGHATGSTLAASLLVVLLWPLLGRAGRVLLVLLAGALAVLTGLDRVYLGVHYPLDVLAGVVLGGSVVALTLLAVPGLRPARDQSSAAKRARARQ